MSSGPGGGQQPRLSESVAWRHALCFQRIQPSWLASLPVANRGVPNSVLEKWDTRRATGAPHREEHEGGGHQCCVAIKDLCETLFTAASVPIFRSLVFHYNIWQGLVLVAPEETKTFFGEWAFEGQHSLCQTLPLGLSGAPGLGPGWSAAEQHGCPLNLPCIESGYESNPIAFRLSRPGSYWAASRWQEVMWHQGHAGGKGGN